jgi:putative nucleotidyltransferase with HDIG domain
MKSIADRFAEVNKELWLILSLLGIALAGNYMLTAQHLILGLYTLPTLFSAYYYGRRHATMTAFASVIVIGLLTHFKPAMFNGTVSNSFVEGYWYDLVSWGSILIITGYAMGTLYERNQRRIQELRQTYYGVLQILRLTISKDKYTENHCYRVSIYASKLAAQLGFNTETTEDIRAASLLHDIGKLDISRELLYKAARLTVDEYGEIQKHVVKSVDVLDSVSGPLTRIIPIILAHHDKYDGSGKRPNRADEIPMEARIISVADVYDALTSDRPYRKAMSPFEAKEIITKGSGTEFDPVVVEAFMKVFLNGEMEVSEVMV